MDLPSFPVADKDAIVTKNKTTVEKDSIQYNEQDLDQEQRVDVNPVQLNTQNLHVHVGDDRIDFSGKITGMTFFEDNKKIATNVSLLLFFGHECRNPIYKTNSDINGNFIIGDLPSGYYTIQARLGENLYYKSHSIKILPCQNVSHLILLKRL